MVNINKDNVMVKPTNNHNKFIHQPFSLEYATINKQAFLAFLQQEIASGRYLIENQDIATCMLADMQL